MNIRSITLFFCMAVLIASCKKDDFGYQSQNYPDVPVTVGNKWIQYNGVPVVQTSLSGGGAITIKLDIPAETGRTIKEIKRVALNSTSNAGYASVRKTTGLYNTAPIAGSGTSVTFTTTVAEYLTKIGSTTTPASGTATSFLGNYFYFLIVLDNGQEVVPVPVRVYVNP